MKRKAARNRYRQPGPSHSTLRLVRGEFVGKPDEEQRKVLFEVARLTQYAHEDAVIEALAALDPLPVEIVREHGRVVDRALLGKGLVLEDSAMPQTDDPHDVLYFWRLEGMRFAAFTVTFAAAVQQAITERTARLQGTSQQELEEAGTCEACGHAAALQVVEEVECACQDCGPTWSETG